MTRYLLFTSSRDGVTAKDVQAALWPRFEPGKVLMAGGARGGDRIVAQLWREWGGQVDEHLVKAVEWQRSRSAGYRRNAEMVAKVRATQEPECVALIARCTKEECPRLEPHGTHGAVHCAGIAEQAGIPVTRIKTGVQPEADSQAALQALAVAGVNAAELDEPVILSETEAWRKWNQAVLDRAAQQQAQIGEQDMTDRNHHQNEADFQERQANFPRERPAAWEARPKQGEFAAEYADMLRSSIARDERQRDAELALGRQEQERQATEAQAEAEQQTPGHLRLASGHEVELSAWDRYVTSQPGSEAHKAAYTDMHRAAKGAGFAGPDPDRSYLAEHGYVRDADRWAMPQRDREPGS